MMNHRPRFPALAEAATGKPGVPGSPASAGSGTVARTLVDAVSTLRTGDRHGVDGVAERPGNV
jgi:hypothetical protein